MACGIAAGVFIAGAAAAFLRLHLLPTGVRPGMDAVADYGLTGYRWHYRVMVVRLGVGGLLVAAGLASRTDAGGLLWLWVYASSGLASAAFKPDPDRWSVSARGRVHLLLCATACASIALAATVVTWTGAPATLRGVGYGVAAAGIAALATRAARPLRRFLGLGERALYVASGLWMFIAAIALAGA
jgi:Protein of unknown function (DUF998)